MARKNKVNYFDMLVTISDHAAQYADELVAFLESKFDEETQEGTLDLNEALDKLKELHRIEEASDEVTHELISNLVNEFVTPIEREDILDLARELDDVVDELDEVIQRMYMYNVSTFPASVLEMARVVQCAVHSVQTACQKFTYFKKSHSIRDYVVKINDAEDEGDVTYIRAVHDVYARAKESGDAMAAVQALGVAGVLAALERCCDACESVGDSITTVITKNS